MSIPALKEAEVCLYITQCCWHMAIYWMDPTELVQLSERTFCLLFLRSYCVYDRRKKNQLNSIFFIPQGPIRSTSSHIYSICVWKFAHIKLLLLFILPLNEWTTFFCVCVCDEAWILLHKRLDFHSAPHPRMLTVRYNNTANRNVP